MKKYILKLSVCIIVLLLVISTFPGKAKANPTEFDLLNWIKFDWQSYTIENRVYKEAAMFIPFSISGLPQKFSAQFDVGANVSLFYSNSFEPYLKGYPNKFADKLDTIRSGQQSWPVIKKLGLAFNNNYIVPVDTIFIQPNYGESIPQDSIFTKTVKHIGTFGFDICRDKIVVIDYPHQHISFNESLPEAISDNFDFVPFKLKNGKIIIPVIIGGEEFDFNFDTGSSITAITMDEREWKRYCNVSKIDSMSANSWGRKLTMVSAPLKSDVYIGNSKMPVANAYENPPEVAAFYKEMDVIGAIGNSYFLHSVIAIDCKNFKFGILKSI